MSEQGVGCKCGWPLDSCNPQLSDGKCGKSEHDGSTMPPEGAVEALAEEFWRLNARFKPELPMWANARPDWQQETREHAARFITEKLAPFIAAKAQERMREKLVSDEALEEMRLDLIGSGWDGDSALCIQDVEGARDDLRAAVEAALAVLYPDTPEGGSG